MSYKSMNTYKETYKIDGKFYTARVDFFQDKMWIESNGCKEEYSLDEYENFEGNMEDFVKS